MTKSLLQFARERKPEILEQMRQLQNELRQLDAIIVTDGKGHKSALEDAEDGSKKTIKEMVLEVLEGHTEGIKASQILELIEAEFGVEVARESLSPQLTRLSKDDGKIKLDGKKWSLI